MYWITIILIFLENNVKEYVHLLVLPPKQPSRPVSKSDCSFSKIIIIFKIFIFLKLKSFPFFPTLLRKKQILQTLSRPPISWLYGVLSHHCCLCCFYDVGQNSDMKKSCTAKDKLPQVLGCIACQLRHLCFSPRTCHTLRCCGEEDEEGICPSVAFPLSPLGNPREVPSRRGYLGGLSPFPGPYPATRWAMELSPFGQKGASNNQGRKVPFAWRVIAWGTSAVSWNCIINQKNALEKDFHRKLPGLFFLSKTRVGHCKMLVSASLED